MLFTFISDISISFKTEVIVYSEFLFDAFISNVCKNFRPKCAPKTFAKPLSFKSSFMFSVEITASLISSSVIFIIKLLLSIILIKFLQFYYIRLQREKKYSKKHVKLCKDL